MISYVADATSANGINRIPLQPRMSVQPTQKKKLWNTKIVIWIEVARKEKRVHVKKTNENHFLIKVHVSNR